MTDTLDTKAQIGQILLKAQDPAALFRALHELRKQQHKYFSIGYISRECGIPSRGYVSEFLNGKRRLNERYWAPVIRCFGLKGRFAEIAQLMFALEDEKDPSTRTSREQRLISLRRSIQNDVGSMPRKLQGLFFAFEVFCAFGLFRNQPSKEELKRYFGREFALEVEYALSALLTIDLISLDSETQRNTLKQSFVRFHDSEDDGLSHYNFLRYAVKDAEAKLKQWHKHEDALFESTVISVRRDSYREFLQKYFEELVVTVRELESPDADTIVRFNVQIYPVR